MPTIGDVLGEALRHHQAGRLPQAEDLYRRLLQVEPDQPDALNLLGVVAAHTGHTDQALGLIGRAVSLQPDTVDFHVNLAQVLRQAERRKEAAEAFRRALSLNPVHAAALEGLGAVCRDLGLHSEAATAYRRLAEAEPGRYDAWFGLGLALQAMNLYRDAVAAYDRALALQPGAAAALTNKGLCLSGLGRDGEGEDCYRQALAVDPGFDAALLNLGNAVLRRRDLAEAAALFDRLAAVRPDLMEGQIGRAELLLEQGDPVAAAGQARRCAEAHPDRPAAWAVLGRMLRMVGRSAEAAEAFERQMRLSPDDPAPAFGAAACRLRMGDFAAGFRGYRARWALAGRLPRHQHIPEWTGQDLGGKTLLVWDEQGAGDTIMCLRFLPGLARRAGRLVFESPHALSVLWPGLEIGTVVLRGQPVPAADYQIAMMDLPGVLGITTQDMGWTGPYIASAADRRRCWAERLGRRDRPRVGLIWAGNPEFSDDRWRSPGLETILPLLARRDVTFVGLQMGAGRKALEAWTPPPNFIDLGREIRDWADTAAILDEVDLLVTSCTGTAHLAGAMGRPVWTLICADADWRWLDGRDDTPWYPSMRLFRQKTLGDWSGAVGAVAADLRVRFGGCPE